MDRPGDDITVAGAWIEQVGREDGKETQVIEAGGTITMPGFIDVHTHGGGGFNLHTTQVHEIQSYAHWIPTTGVTSFLVAVVGTPGALPEQQLRTTMSAIEQQGSNAKPEAEILGIHLEGPYINEKRRGAHPTTWLRTPNEREIQTILELTQGYLRIITLAPELPGAEQVIRQLVDAGVTVSIGHTDANYEQTQAAIRSGITHATHCFNAMRPLLHREPGPVAAIAQVSGVRGELIADGIHVDPAMMDMLVRMLGPERTVIVTDAQAAAGIPNGTFEFAGQRAEVVSGAARLVDGTLAGSVLTMDCALRNVLDMTHVSLSEAVRMLTYNPAQAAGVDTRKGKLHPGYDADLLIFDEHLTLQATLCRGRIAFATSAWRERLNRIEEGE
jgi:N-acetylglucosamine-6-phosphate deacetylase